MFKKTGNALIDKGLKSLTDAITQIEAGIKTNAGEISKNNETINSLTSTNEALSAENTKAQTVVDNFRKNILGE